MRNTFVAATLFALAAAASAETHILKPTPTTVAWGYYDAAAPPVLRVQSGDVVEVQTLLTSSPSRLEGAGVPPAQVEQSLGRPLSTAPTVSVNVIPPGTVYGDRLNQLDVRLGKNFRVQRYRINASVDVYNVLNSDAVLNEKSAYLVWRTPLSVVKPRFVKFSAQLDF